MREIWKLIRLFRDHITGELAYQNHLKHCGKNKSSEKISIDRKTFLRNREKSRWDKVNRCC